MCVSSTGRQVGGQKTIALFSFSPDQIADNIVVDLDSQRATLLRTRDRVLYICFYVYACTLLYVCVCTMEMLNFR